MTWLYHLTDWPADWPAALAPRSLASEGFVHLSGGSQLLATAQRWFEDRSRLGVLVLDPRALGLELRWDEVPGRGEAFPHLYAPIPEAAVVTVARLERQSDGRFAWPDWLPSPGDASPLLEPPDPGPALIEPSRRFAETILPASVVMACFPEAVKRWEASPWVRRRHQRPGSAIGPSSVLELSLEGQRVGLCSPGVGGPLAAVAVEELVALGARTLVLCGGAGGLQPGNRLGQVVLVDRALRDEGASHHYLEAARWVETEPRLLQAAHRELQARGVEVQVGATWTTDALYRETPDRLQRRRQQGCLTVEMECASALAVARFRGVGLLPLLFCGDDLSTERWAFRQWTEAQSHQDRLVGLALELAGRLAALSDPPP